MQEARALFLAALRSGLYPKGPIATDSRGTPLDKSIPGYCAIGLAYTLFTDKRNAAPVHYRKALGLSRVAITRIQQEWNDSPLTFSEIADLIQTTYFKDTYA